MSGLSRTMPKGTVAPGKLLPQRYEMPPVPMKGFTSRPHFPGRIDGFGLGGAAWSEHGRSMTSISITASVVMQIRDEPGCGRRALTRALDKSTTLAPSEKKHCLTEGQQLKTQVKAYREIRLEPNAQNPYRISSPVSAAYLISLLENGDCGEVPVPLFQHAACGEPHDKQGLKL